jgi:hypothetical protein
MRGTTDKRCTPTTVGHSFLNTWQTLAMSHLIFPFLGVLSDQLDLYQLKTVPYSFSKTGRYCWWRGVCLSIEKTWVSRTCGVAGPGVVSGPHSQFFFFCICTFRSTRSILIKDSAILIFNNGQVLVERCVFEY